jgi:phosphoglycolate phosphatase
MGAVLFDLDGTLTDPEEGITRSAAYALEHFGIHVEDPHTLTPFIGPPLKDSFMQFYGFSDADALRAVELYRERFSVTGIFENRPYDGVGELLSSLAREGLTLAVASSKPEVFVKRIMEHFGLSAPFAAVCGSELDGRRVKKAEVIAYALETLGLSPSPAVVMVGDRSHDVAGAKANGLRCVGALFGFGGREELEAAGADYLAESVEDLGRVLRAIPELWS